MNHPHQLHARAHLRSLEAALHQLVAAAVAADRAAAADHDLGTLQAWRPGTVGRTSGHGDVLLDAVVRHVGGPSNPYADRAGRTYATVHWLAKSALADAYRPGRDDVTQLREQLHTVSPATAGDIARWIGEQDQAVRQLLGEPDDHHLIPAIECPACDRAGALALRMSGPADNRVVVCTATVCFCAGDECPCGMAVTAASVRHVWTMTEFRTKLDT